MNKSSPPTKVRESANTFRNNSTESCLSRYLNHLIKVTQKCFFNFLQLSQLLTTNRKARVGNYE